MSSAEAGTPPLQALLDAFNAHDVDAIMSSSLMIASLTRRAGMSRLNDAPPPRALRHSLEDHEVAACGTNERAQSKLT